MADTSMEVERTCGFQIHAAQVSQPTQVAFGYTKDHLYRRTWNKGGDTVQYHRTPRASVPDAFDVKNNATFASVQGLSWEALYNGAVGPRSQTFKAN